ncbi:hypothetical protein ElyMa_003445800 [Elysia marginata]|uniref:Uncharacterized protein n=1 Tax=Elysia marginata TaxID=1093978 RepID=A0AAV4JS63_9GAST|nr:hypothetical protein ElyMa_003445800 [Elysia marginata]
MMKKKKKKNNNNNNNSNNNNNNNITQTVRLSSVMLYQRRRLGQLKACCHTMMEEAFAQTTPSQIILAPGRPDFNSTKSIMPDTRRISC